MIRLFIHKDGKIKIIKINHLEEARFIVSKSKCDYATVKIYNAGIVKQIQIK